MAMDLDLLDDIINRLLDVRGRPGKQVQLLEGEIRQLCVVSREIFLKQPNLLELEAPIKICGDIHGQYPDLLRLFEYGGVPPTASYLFMGNYVDYGKQSLETICLLLAFKVKYPENFFLLRGNHECASVNRIYGFYDECKRRFNVRIWKIFIDCFNCIPVAAVIDEKVLCMHGGLSPDFVNLDQIRNIPRPTAVPDTGLLCDLLWADPCRDVKGWGMNDRGVSYTFGADKVSEFLVKHDLDLICRGHQVVEDGYEFFADRQMVTIFSAPNFRGEYDNAGAIMSIDETLMCSFQILKPAERRAKFLFSNATSSGSSSPPLRSVLGTRVTAAAAEEKNATRSVTPPCENKSEPATKARARDSVSQLIRQRRENEKQLTSPRKEKSRPPTPARDNVKQVTSPPRKGKSRPVTPARENASRSISPFRMDCIRPKTPPRKNKLRSQTPIRKEQKQ